MSDHDADVAAVLCPNQKPNPNWTCRFCGVRLHNGDDECGCGQYRLKVTSYAEPNVAEWWSLPGEPLYSGFDNWRPATRMTVEAEARVFAKMDSTDRARAKAHAASITAVVG